MLPTTASIPVGQQAHQGGAHAASGMASCRAACINGGGWPSVAARADQVCHFRRLIHILWSGPRASLPLQRHGWQWSWPRASSLGAAHAVAHHAAAQPSSSSCSIGRYPGSRWRTTSYIRTAPEFHPLAPSFSAMALRRSCPQEASMSPPRLRRTVALTLRFCKHLLKPADGLPAGGQERASLHVVQGDQVDMAHQPPQQMRTADRRRHRCRSPRRSWRIQRRSAGPVAAK